MPHGKKVSSSSDKLIQKNVLAQLSRPLASFELQSQHTEVSSNDNWAGRQKESDTIPRGPLLPGGVGLGGWGGDLATLLLYRHSWVLGVPGSLASHPIIVPLDSACIRGPAAQKKNRT